MIRFLADENFNGVIVTGLRLLVPTVEILRIQDTELDQRPDPIILSWAAEKRYALLTHDVNTMPGYFYDRAKANQPLPLLFMVHNDKPIGAVIKSLQFIIETDDEAAWAGIPQYLPL